MPGIVGHMAVAKTVGEELNINSDEFYQGNLLPDILEGSKRRSHFKKQGRFFHIPNTLYYRESFDLDSDQNLGYYTHLLLDRYFMDEFIPSITRDRDIFRSRTIYDDYDKSNASIIEYFALDVEEILPKLVFSNPNIDLKRLGTNLECLTTTKEGNTSIIDIDDYISFLEDSSYRIADDVKTYQYIKKHYL